MATTVTCSDAVRACSLSRWQQGNCPFGSATVLVVPLAQRRRELPALVMSSRHVYPQKFLSSFRGAIFKESPSNGSTHISATASETGGDGTNGTGGLGGNGGSGGEGGDGHDSGDGGDSGEKKNFALLWQNYLLSLDNYPVRVKAFTSMLLNLLGDLFCQVFIEKNEKLDLRRLCVTAILGFALVGPSLHFWYSTLSKLVTATGTAGAALRLVLDQFIFSPAFISVFFCVLLTLEGRPQDISPKLKQEWWTTVVTNWKIWIPFQFLNFRLVPLQLQVAAANVIALAWNVYLSFASHTKMEASTS